MVRGNAVTSRDASPLSVDVAEILRRPGTSKKVGLVHPAGDIGVSGTGPDLRIDLVLDSLVDGVSVHGTVATTTGLECARCLAPVRGEITVELDEVCLRPGEGEEGETYEIRDEVVDLVPVLRDAIALSIPQVTLCREDCRGLCPECGADRNEDDCGHDAGRRDVRWGALADLRERMEG